MQFKSTVPVLVAINDKLYVVVVIFLVVATVTLTKISQFTIKSRHKALIQVKIKVLLCNLSHFYLKIQQLLRGLKKELIFIGVRNADPLCPKSHPHFGQLRIGLANELVFRLLF